MEIYNKHFIPLTTNGYESEIAFIESFDDFNKNFLQRDEFWIEFKDEYRKLNGFYQMNIPVNNFFGKAKTDFLERYKDKIHNVECAHRHYAYIKIINDKHNPHLNGNTMLFRYGRKIHEMLLAYPNTTFSRTFLLRIRMVSGFQNFDGCNFTLNNYYVKDVNLNVRNIPNLRKLDLIKDLERRHKLSQITKKIKDKDDEKICM